MFSFFKSSNNDSDRNPGPSNARDTDQTTDTQDGFLDSAREVVSDAVDTVKDTTEDLRDRAEDFLGDDSKEGDTDNAPLGKSPSTMDTDDIETNDDVRDEVNPEGDDTRDEDSREIDSDAPALFDVDEEAYDVEEDITEDDNTTDGDVDPVVDEPHDDQMVLSYDGDILEEDHTPGAAPDFDPPAPAGDIDTDPRDDFPETDDEDRFDTADDVMSFFEAKDAQEITETVPAEVIPAHPVIEVSPEEDEHFDNLRRQQRERGDQEDGLFEAEDESTDQETDGDSDESGDSEEDNSLLNELDELFNESDEERDDQSGDELLNEDNPILDEEVEDSFLDDADVEDDADVDEEADDYDFLDADVDAEDEPVEVTSLVEDQVVYSTVPRTHQGYAFGDTDYIDEDDASAQSVDPEDNTDTDSVQDVIPATGEITALIHQQYEGDFVEALDDTFSGRDVYVVDMSREKNAFQILPPSISPQFISLPETESMTATDVQAIISDAADHPGSIIAVVGVDDIAASMTQMFEVGSQGYRLLVESVRDALDDARNRGVSIVGVGRFATPLVDDALSLLDREDSQDEGH